MKKGLKFISYSKPWYRKFPGNVRLNNVLPTFDYDFLDGLYFSSGDFRKTAPLSVVRTSNATQFNKEGKLVYAPHNLCSRGNNFGVAWSSAGEATITQDGPFTGNGFQMSSIDYGATATNGLIFVPTTIASGSPICFQIKLKYKNWDWVRVQVYSGAVVTDAIRCFVNVRTGVIGTVQSSGTWTGATATIENQGNGIFEVALRGVANSTDPIMLISTAQADGNTTRQANSGFYASEAQFELADISSPKPYNDTNGSVYYGPRFDFHPQTLASRGLLIEQTTTNNVTVSESTGTIQGTSSVAPTTILGVTGTRRFTADATAAVAKASIGGTFTAAATTTYTVSAYVRYVTQQFVQLATTINASIATDYVNFDLSNGTITATGATAVGEIQPTNETGVYRISMTFTSIAAPVAGASVVLYFITTGTDLRGAATSVSGTIVDFMGMQHEAGAKMTSLIPTYSVAATRAFDSIDYPLGSWINLGVGTFYVEAEISRRVAQTETLFNVGNSGFTERLQLRLNNASQYSTIITVGGVLQSTSPSNPVATVGNQKIALRYSSGSQTHCVNGVLGTDGNIASLPTAPTSIYLGKLGTSSTEVLNGWLKEIRYYPDNSASNAQLQALTS